MGWFIFNYLPDDIGRQWLLLNVMWFSNNKKGIVRAMPFQNIEAPASSVRGGGELPTDL